MIPNEVSGRMADDVFRLFKYNLKNKLYVLSGVGYHDGRDYISLRICVRLPYIYNVRKGSLKVVEHRIKEMFVDAGHHVADVEVYLVQADLKKAKIDHRLVRDYAIQYIQFKIDYLPKESA